MKPRSHPFAFEAPVPWPPEVTLSASMPERQTGSVARAGRESSDSQTRSPQTGRRIYWQALIDATDDLNATPSEVEYLRSLRERYSLSLEEVRALHARLFAERVLEMARDDRFTASEAERTQQLASALGALGWCPGMPTVA